MAGTEFRNGLLQRFAATLLLLAPLVLAGCGINPVAIPASEAKRVADAPLPEAEPYVRVIAGQEVRDLSALSGATPSGAVKGNLLDEVRLEEMQFSGTPLSSATLMLTKMIGQNIVASAEAQNRKVTVYLRNVTARAAIEAVCRLNNLWYREDGEMIRLLTREEYGRELVIKSNDQTRLYYLKNASALGVANMITALMPDQVQYAQYDAQTGDDSSFGHVGTDGNDPMTNTRTSNGINSTSNLAPGTYPEYPGVPGTNTGVARSTYAYSATDVASNFQKGLSTGKVEELARNAITRQKGEVTAQAVAENTGVKPPVTISVFLRNNCIGVRSVQESVHSEIGKIIEALDTPTRQVLLEIKVLRVALTNDFESVFSLAYSNAGSTLKWLPDADTDGSTLSFTYLDQHIAATLKLLQTDNRLHTVATPMLLCANNAPAEFFSGVTRMITTNYDYETRYGENNQAVDIARPIVQERNIGTDVKIAPSINTDGTVTMRFYLDIGTVNEQGANIFEVNSKGEVIALPIDTINNEKAESIVVAKHGQAVVMGGLISESVLRNRRRVPVAGDIPIIGTFLGKREDKVERTETIMIIIPHIIATSAQGQGASDTVLQNNATHPLATNGRKALTRWHPQTNRLEEIDQTKTLEPAPKTTPEEKAPSKKPETSDGPGPAPPPEAPPAPGAPATTEARP